MKILSTYKLENEIKDSIDTIVLNAVKSFAEKVRPKHNVTKDCGCLKCGFAWDIDAALKELEGKKG